MLDWRTGEEGWYGVQEPRGRRQVPPPARRRIPRWLVLLFGALLVVIGGFAISLRWKSRQQTARLRQDIQATVDTESWARETHNLLLYQSLLDPAAKAGWRERQQQAFEAGDLAAPTKMTVVDVMLVGTDLAVGELELTPVDGQPYRATRAYRRSGGMWLETSIPGNQVWLDQATRETNDLRFVFHQRDAAQITAVMPAIQALYARLLRDLVLSPPQGKRTLYVIRSVRPIESDLVNDPTYYDLSDLGPGATTEGIERRLGALLVEQIVGLFRTEQGELPLLVRSVGEWEYADWLGVPPPEPQATSEQDLLVSLPFLSLIDETWESLEYPAAQALAGRVFVDYVVETYGRAGLADIVRSARRYDDRHPLVTQALDVPLVLHAPFVEFDAGWRNYALRAFTRLEGTRLDLLRPVKSEFLRPLVEEQRAVQQNDLDLYDSLLAEDSDPEWRDQQHQLFDIYQFFRQSTNAPFRLRLQDVILAGDDALLRVEVSFPDPGATLYQEMRTYHRFDNEWKWTSTLASFRILSTEEEGQGLRVHYHWQDAGIIRAELPATGAFYAQVARDLTVRRPPVVDIDVVPDYQVLDWRSDYQKTTSLPQVPGGTAVLERTFIPVDPPPRVQVLSPTLGMIVTDMSPADFYRMSTGLALSRYLIATQTETPSSAFAGMLYEAIARWETEQWAAELPWTKPRRQAISTMLQAGVRPSLRGRPTLTEQHVDPVMGYLYDTAVAYVVETYGRPYIGKLVQHASQHQGWDRLIPDVLGVKFEDFEAGWIEYLQGMTNDE